MARESADGATEPVNRYPLPEDQAEYFANLHLDFEMPLEDDLSPMKYNQNPLFIYSGNGSLFLDEGPFRAMYSGQSRASYINFWIYPLGEGEINFKIDWYSQNFFCGGTPQDYGAHGSTVRGSQEFAAPAGEWTKISTEINSGAYDLHWNIYVDPNEGSTSFYLDEMSFENPLQSP